jgi:aminomethyltransferase
MTLSPATTPLQVPLARLHRRLGARMVTFAGYEMPLHYSGIIAEHLHTREAASLFDVSHMGIASLSGDLDAFERLVVGDIRGMANGQVRYTLMTNAKGGVVDDLMVSHFGHSLWLVVNASRKRFDFAHIGSHIAGMGELHVREDMALLALQGPLAATVLGRFAPGARLMLFMTSEFLKIGEVRCWVSRAGYTGEDGYEIGVPIEHAETVAELLLAEPEVKPAGLGARDTLRLEAGLCLYGNDLDENTTPVEAGLAWTIHRRRRDAADFPGAPIILKQLEEGPSRQRVGIRLSGKVPARAGSLVSDSGGRPIGKVTSGSFAPSLGVPIALAYVERGTVSEGSVVRLNVRDKQIKGQIVKLPFVPHRYAKS